MALTVATGFVVDDAIVVLENTARHIEAGMDRMKAALLGAQEVGFTVLSISVSLVAVFIPLLFMQGQVGRLFREFAITLSAAVMISLVISLTTTPMLCAWLLAPGGAAKDNKRGRLNRWAERGFARVLSLVRGEPRLGAGQPLARPLHPRLRDRPQRLSLQRRAEGLLPAAGHRPAPAAACAPTRASRRRRWARSSARWSTSSAAIRRSRRSSASPAAAAPAAASCSSTSSRRRSARRAARR